MITISCEPLHKTPTRARNGTPCPIVFRPPTKKGGHVFKKCLVFVSPHKQHESMTTKNSICILASAILLVSCTPTTTTTPTATTTGVRPTPTPRPLPTPHPRSPSPGKRTETGTVIGLTATEITLTTASDGTWVISRTDSCTTIKAGSLALGSTNVTIEFCAPPGYQPST